jgi:hypothetical protein
MEPPQRCHSVWQQWKVCTPKASLLFSPHIFLNPFIYTIFYAVCSQQGYICNQIHSGTYRQCRQKFGKAKDTSVRGVGKTRTSSQSNSPWFPKQHCILYGIHTSPRWSSSKINMLMEMSAVNCCNDTYREKQKYAEKILLHCDCVHYRSHPERHGIKPVLQPWVQNHTVQTQLFISHGNHLHVTAKTHPPSGRLGKQEGNAYSCMLSRSRNITKLRYIVYITLISILYMWS